jgi:hypothetical protein
MHQGWTRTDQVDPRTPGLLYESNANTTNRNLSPENPFRNLLGAMIWWSILSLGFAMSKGFSNAESIGSREVPSRSRD